jgi:hypothetical protein
MWLGLQQCPSLPFLMYLFTYLFIHSFIHLLFILFIYVFIYLFIYLFIHLFTYLFIHAFFIFLANDSTGGPRDPTGGDQSLAGHLRRRRPVDRRLATSDRAGERQGTSIYFFRVLFSLGVNVTS